MHLNHHSQQKINAVLFDLDGTLLDTAPDLAASLNQILQSQHRSPLPLSVIRPHISQGAASLLKLGFNIVDSSIEGNDATVSNLLQQFRKNYSQHSCEKTQLFPFIDTLLLYLEKEFIPWGIVTNKPMALTKPLINHFSLLKKAQCIVAGDTLAVCKPDPRPLLYACTCIGHPPQHCVYVGDAKSDVDAANAAGMRSLVALYGYIPNKQEPHSWQANAMINTPLELIDWLTLNKTTR